jgi:hypothetical protein
VGEGAEVVGQPLPALHRADDRPGDRLGAFVIGPGPLGARLRVVDDADLVFLPLLIGIALAGLHAPAVRADDQQSDRLSGRWPPIEAAALEELLGLLVALPGEQFAHALGRPLDALGADAQPG